MPPATQQDEGRGGGGATLRTAAQGFSASGLFKILSSFPPLSSVPPTRLLPLFSEMVDIVRHMTIGLNVYLESITFQGQSIIPRLRPNQKH